MASNSSAARAACLARARPEVSSHTLRPVPAQQLGDRRPFGIEERFAAGQKYHLGVQLLETGQQARDRRKIHIVPTMPPVVAGYALGIASIGQVESDQRQAVQRQAPLQRAAERRVNCEGCSGQNAAPLERDAVRTKPSRTRAR